MESFIRNLSRQPFGPPLLFGLAAAAIFIAGMKGGEFVAVITGVSG